MTRAIRPPAAPGAEGRGPAAGCLAAPAPSGSTPSGAAHHPLRDAIWTALLLLGLVLILLRDSVFTGRALLPVDLIYSLDPVWQALAPPGFTAPGNALQADVAHQFYPWRVYAAHWLGQGVLPLWNPLILGGVSFVGNDQSALFYPINLITYLLPVSAAPTLSAVLRLLIAGLATYGYLRVIGRGLAAARLGAMAFMLSGWIITWLQWPHVNVAVWLPAILLLIEVIFRSGSWWWAGPLALVVGAQFLGGHVETSFHLAVISAAYLVFLAAMTWRQGHGSSGASWGRIPVLERGRPARPGPPERETARPPLRHAALRGTIISLVGALAGVGIGAIQVLPFLEQLARSSLVAERSGSLYAGSPLYFPGVWRDLLTLPTLVFPHLLGTPTDPVYWAFAGNFNESVAYVGTVPLALALVALGSLRSDARVAFWAAAALVAIGVAYRLPLFEAMNHLPLFDVAANGRLRLVFSFAIVVLAAAGLDRVLAALLRSTHPDRRLILRTAVAAAVFGIASLGGLVGGYILLGVWGEEILRFGRDYVTTSVYGQPSLPQDLPTYLAKVDTYYAVALDRFRPFNPKLYGAVAAAIGLAALLWLGARRRLRPAALAVAFPALTAAELLIYGSGLNPTVDAGHIFPATPIIDFLRERAGTDRVAGLELSLTPNSAMVWGLRDLRGYEVVRPARTWDLLGEIEGRRPFGDHLLLSHAQSPLLDLMAVRYIVATSSQDGAIRDGLRPIFARDGVIVYENDRAMPRARIVGRTETVADPDQILVRVRDRTAELESLVLLEASQQPPVAGLTDRPGSARIITDRPDEVVVDTRLDGAGYLVLSDSYDEGWEATVDGVPATIYRANHAFRAVRIEAGDHLVRFSYRPAAFAIGVAVTATSLVLAVALCGLAAGGRLSGRRGRRSPAR